MIAEFPRVMFSAVASGGGKTTVTCGVLKALCDRGMRLSAFKCGPDYIDPLFHREMIGAKSSNLDLFFTDEETTKSIYATQAEGTELSIIEGVMGYYDGLGGTTTTASAYHLSQVMDCPTVLIVDGKGTSISICAQVQGFCNFRENTNIVGVILNRCNPMVCKMLKPFIEESCKVEVLGCLPYSEAYAMESRHLGLVTAQEVADLQEKLQKLGAAVEKDIDLERLIEIAQGANPLEYQEEEIEEIVEAQPVIAVARDRAFCFYYEESLQLLEKLGAKLVYFSPLADEEIPSDASGLYMGGGYPELHLETLAANHRTKKSVYEAIAGGMPTLAECGGFMYLTKSIEGHAMVGCIDGSCHNTGKLGRFGYITLTAKVENILCDKDASIPAHEFHYYDCTMNGDGFHAKKPIGTRQWEAGYVKDNVVAGFPHLYLRGNIEWAKRFVRKCEGWK